MVPAIRDLVNNFAQFTVIAKTDILLHAYLNFKHNCYLLCIPYQNIAL